MFRILFCCFTNKTKTNTGSDTDTDQKSKINAGIKIQPKHDSDLDIDEIRDINSINIFNTTSIYDLVLKNMDTPIDWKDTIPFIPPITSGFVIKVYDGDTITIASTMPYSNSPLYRFSVRLNGIDCPEIKSKNDDEHACALLAKTEMTNMVLHKIITLKNIQTEKYGRILADVYIDDLHVNKHMLDNHLAVAYDGGTKKSPESWLSYYYKNEL
jgi:endonuclease YncB( thermonuclease family)